VDAGHILWNRSSRNSIIARSAYKLTKLTLGKDKLLWGIFIVLAVSTAWTSREIVWLFLVAGVVALTGQGDAQRAQVETISRSVCCLVRQRSQGAVAYSEFFSKLTPRRSFCIRSGLAVVPFLYGGVCKNITGPHRSAICRCRRGRDDHARPSGHHRCLHGYLVAGLSGATVAALGIFFPVYLIVVFACAVLQAVGQKSPIECIRPRCNSRPRPGPLPGARDRAGTNARSTGMLLP